MALCLSLSWVTDVMLQSYAIGSHHIHEVWCEEEYRAPEDLHLLLLFHCSNKTIGYSWFSKSYIDLVEKIFEYNVSDWQLCFCTHCHINQNYIGLHIKYIIWEVKNIRQKLSMETHCRCGCNGPHILSKQLRRLIVKSGQERLETMLWRKSPSHRSPELESAPLSQWVSHLALMIIERQPTVNLSSIQTMLTFVLTRIMKCQHDTKHQPQEIRPTLHWQVLFFMLCETDFSWVAQASIRILHPFLLYHCLERFSFIRINFHLLCSSIFFFSIQSYCT